jgi:D-3-phosphoglycerate dehydrogenase
MAGAAIDTWAEEPMPPDNPLLEVDPLKTVLTGHSIAHSARLPQILVEAAAENVARELRGELPLYTVNPAVEPRWRGRLAQLAAGQGRAATT